KQNPRLSTLAIPFTAASVLAMDPTKKAAARAPSIMVNPLSRISHLLGLLQNSEKQVAIPIPSQSIQDKIPAVRNARRLWIFLFFKVMLEASSLRRMSIF